MVLNAEATGTGHQSSNEQAAIVARIRALIHERELLPGEKLGTERQLARDLSITRAELRVALAALESVREISRKIGRDGGIVVSDRRLERNINTVESLPMIARKQGFVLSSRVLSAVIASASPSDRRLLELDRTAVPSSVRIGSHSDACNVYNITRLRFIDGTPLSLEISHLPSAVFPMLLVKDLTQPFYALFDQYYGIRPSSVHETLESVVASAREAEFLQVATGTPLIRIRRIARDEGGMPFERANDLYIADRMRFTMQHTGYVRLSATTRKHNRTD